MNLKKSEVNTLEFLVSQFIMPILEVSLSQS